MCVYTFCAFVCCICVHACLTAHTLLLVRDFEFAHNVLLCMFIWNLCVHAPVCVCYMFVCVCFHLRYCACMHTRLFGHVWVF